MNLIFWKITAFLNTFFSFLSLHYSCLHAMVWAPTIINMVRKIMWHLQHFVIILENHFFFQFLSLHDSFQLHAMVWAVTMVNVVRNVMWQHQKPLSALSVLKCSKNHCITKHSSLFLSLHDSTYEKIIFFNCAISILLLK